MAKFIGSQNRPRCPSSYPHTVKRGRSTWIRDPRGYCRNNRTYDPTSTRSMLIKWRNLRGNKLPFGKWLRTQN